MGSAPATSDIRKKLETAGFEVVEAGSRLGAKKYNCIRYIEQRRGSDWLPVTPSYFYVRGFECELEDRGYQKFWLASRERFPVRIGDLRFFHDFDQELRAVLGLKSFYNESLGSTNARTVYDRLDGRPDTMRK